MNKRWNIKEKELKRLQNTFNRFKLFLPKAYHSIQLSVVFTEDKDYKTYQGGYTTLSTICIGSEFLNTFKDELSIPEILAHELGHQVLGHIHVGFDRQVNPSEEQDADLFGMYLCEMAGFKRSNYIGWFTKFENGKTRKKMSKKHIEEHGTGQERIDRLKEHHQYLLNISNI